MFRRFLAFLVLALLLGAFGSLFYWNPGTVEFRLTGTRAYALPLPLLLLVSFSIGGALVFVLALVRETQWSLRSRRWRIEERRREKLGTALASGRELLWHGRPERARAALRRGARPGDTPEASLLLAESALEDGFLEEAEAIANQALERQPSHPHLLALLADVHRRRGEPGKATSALERATAAEPDSRRLAAELRDEYVRQGRWLEALHAEERVLALLRTPEEVLAEQRTWKGIRYEVAEATEDDHERIEQLRALVAEDAGFVPAAVALGDELRRAGSLREAGRVWIRAARVRPLTVLLGRIEAVYRELGRPKKVLAFYRRLLAGGAASPLAFRLVRFHLTNGDLEAAEAELQSLEESSSDTREFLLLRAELHRLRGHTELALQAFRRASDPLDAAAADGGCQLCGRPSPRWLARCPSCGAWDALH